MKKYFMKHGYTQSSSNDLTPNTFYLENITYQLGESTTFNSFKLDRIEAYKLRVKTLDGDKFGNKMEEMLNDANQDNDISDIAMEANREENSYLIAIEFKIRST